MIKDCENCLGECLLYDRALGRMAKCPQCNGTGKQEGSAIGCIVGFLVMVAFWGGVFHWAGLL